MSDNIYLKKLHCETFEFFDRILTSDSLQAKYDLLDYPNIDFVLNIIKEFKESRNAYLVKPFYETDYSPSNVPRSILIKRDDYGFLTAQLNLPNSEPYYIEPFRFVSIIKELIEDENIKKEVYSEAEHYAEDEHCM